MSAYGQQVPLVTSSGSDDTIKIKNHNDSTEFFWMLNAKGVKVPVPRTIVADALKRGYSHTDKQVYSDDLSKDVHNKEVQPPIDPVERMAEAVTKLAETQEATTEILEEVTQVKRKGRPRKLVAEQEEVSA